MIEDVRVQEIINFALGKQEPLRALRTLERAGRIAAVYAEDPSEFDDWNGLFSRSNTK